VYFTRLKQLIQSSKLELFVLNRQLKSIDSLSGGKQKHYSGTNKGCF